MIKSTLSIISLFLLISIVSCKPKKEEVLNQTGMNISLYEKHLVMIKKLDSTHRKILNQYTTYEYLETAEDTLRVNQIHDGLVENYKAWKTLGEQEDAILMAVFDGGSMLGSVVNYNGIKRIEARLEFYKQFN